jgi:predicted 3-demethylubiquinone-9 3-methyltransferase (glyoxalase superfamily)
MPLDAYPWSERYAWVEDRFGASWQDEPADLVGWMTSEDTAARDRAFDAMLRMKKLDIAALRRAFDRG